MPHFDHMGTKLHYEITGEGRPLLFVHGLGSRGEDWSLQVPHFSSQYQTITVDVRGHGRSDKPTGPYSVSLFANDINALLDHLSIESLPLIGISMGGMIGFQLAVEHPQKLQSLVVVNSTPALVSENLGDSFKLFQRRLFMKLLSRKRIAAFLSKRLFPKPAQNPLREQFEAAWLANDEDAYKASFNAIVGWDVREHLSDIKCPTLVIAGDRDYTPTSRKERFVKRMPNARLVEVADSGHATPIDQPEIFNQVLQEFLKEVYPTPSQA